MEVRWVGVEPPKLGLSHSAVSIIFSVLLGNVFHFLSSPFYLLHLHYVTAGMHNSFTSVPLSLTYQHPALLKTTLLAFLFFWCQYNCCIVEFIV